jgi:hypothetical protein
MVCAYIRICTLVPVGGLEGIAGHLKPGVV